MQVCRASMEMQDALKQIWMDCFGDSPAYTDFYFDRMFRTNEVFVSLTDENKVAAMLTARPLQLQTPAGSLSGAYIFAVATSPAFQGQGLSTHLLNETHKQLGAEGTALSVLVPASPSLFSFYGKRGYHTAFHKKELEVLPEQLSGKEESIAFSPLNASHMHTLRQAAFGTSLMWGNWNPAYLNFVLEECRYGGGEALAFSTQGRGGYAICYPAPEGFFVKELVCEPEFAGAVLKALQSKLGGTKWQLRLPADYPINAENTVLPFAMVRWYDKNAQEGFLSQRGKEPYLSHVMD